MQIDEIGDNNTTPPLTHLVAGQAGQVDLHLVHVYRQLHIQKQKHKPKHKPTATGQQLAGKAIMGGEGVMSTNKLKTTDLPSGRYKLLVTINTINK